MGRLLAVMISLEFCLGWLGLAHAAPPAAITVGSLTAFAASYAATVPATALPGNATSSAGLVLASAAAETVGDAIARYYVTTTGDGSGLRGGTFSLSPTKVGYHFDLDNFAWAEDLSVSGKIDWNQLTGDITAQVVLDATGPTGTIET